MKPENRQAAGLPENVCPCGDGFCPGCDVEAAHLRAVVVAEQVQALADERAPVALPPRPTRAALVALLREFLHAQPGTHAHRAAEAHAVLALAVEDSAAMAETLEELQATSDAQAVLRDEEPMVLDGARAAYGMRA